MVKDTASYREVVDEIRKSREENKQDNKDLKEQMEQQIKSLTIEMNLKFDAVTKEVKGVKEYIDGNYVLKEKFDPIAREVSGFRRIILLFTTTVFTSLIGAGVAIFTSFLKK